MKTITEYYYQPGSQFSGPESYATGDLFNLIKGREANGWSVRLILSRSDGDIVVYEVES